MSPLILASGSTARARLLRTAGVRLEIIPADIDEEKTKTACRKKGFSTDETAAKLAELKALHVSGKQPGRLVLGADQILDLDGERALQAVGCYEIEGLGAQLFERMEGDFFSIVGLPLLPVLGALRQHGLTEQ